MKWGRKEEEKSAWEKERTSLKMSKREEFVKLEEENRSIFGFKWRKLYSMNEGGKRKILGQN